MKNQHASELGKLGGRATADAMTADERKARAAKAGAARWAGKSAEEKAAHSALMRAGRKPKSV